MSLSSRRISCSGRLPRPATTSCRPDQMSRANFSNLSSLLESKPHDCVPQAGAKRNEVPTQRSCLWAVSDSNRSEGMHAKDRNRTCPPPRRSQRQLFRFRPKLKHAVVGGRNAAIGLGIAGAALDAAAIANGAGYYGPGYGYGYAPRRYYDANYYYYDGPGRHRHRHHHYGWWNAGPDKSGPLSCSQSLDEFEEECLA